LRRVIDVTDVRVPFDRLALLQRAQAIRQKQANYRMQMKAHQIDPWDVIAKRDQEQEVARMRVDYFLESIPGVGQTKTRCIMADLKADDTHRLEDLSFRQLKALETKLPRA
jgi:hypothetical protein